MGLEPADGLGLRLTDCDGLVEGLPLGDGLRLMLGLVLTGLALADGIGEELVLCEGLGEGLALVEWLSLTAAIPFNVATRKVKDYRNLHGACKRRIACFT